MGALGTGRVCNLHTVQSTLLQSQGKLFETEVCPLLLNAARKIGCPLAWILKAIATIFALIIKLVSVYIACSTWHCALP